jgi:hypothetical protein
MALTKIGHHEDGPFVQFRQGLFLHVLLDILDSIFGVLHLMLRFAFCLIKLSFCLSLRVAGEATTASFTAPLVLSHSPAIWCSLSVTRNNAR